MCGIVGLISKKQYGFDSGLRDLFTSLLQMDTIRGADSTGAFGVDKDGQIDIIKGDTNGWQFTHCKKYSNFADKIYSVYHIVIGHNRAATKGLVTPHNAHPFKEDNICLVHNGTIYNQDELDKNTEVDSHAITKALTKSDAKTALNLIHGPFALVWFDATQKTLNLARNQERPLFLLEYENFWTIASEPGLPYWLNGREGRKIVGVPKLIPTEKILRFPLDNLANGYSEIEFDNYVYEHVPVTSSYPVVHKLPHRASITINSTGIKAGDEIIFNVDDIKHEPEDPLYTIFGHPLFHGELDTNILVKTTKAHKADVDALQVAGYACGNVSSLTEAGQMTVVIVGYCQPHYVHLDKNNNSTTEQDIKAAIAQGCNKCKGAMSFIDIASSIIRKKKDGTYRTLCKTCLEESISNIPMKKGRLLAN